MRTTLGKLRVAVVVLALLLVVSVAGIVVYGRHLAHRWAVSLPKRLTKELLQESFNVSFSHSEHGKTVFTVHAAKEQKWTSGLITLDDVGIELYGRQDGATDRIHGSKFEFDQAKGELRAVGEVFIDLAAPAGKDGAADGQKALHVKTSGLIFNQKARTASTGEGIEFEAGGLRGTAVGADYDSARQFVVLRSAVRVNGLRDNRPVALTAAYAELDRKANVADLRDAKYVSQGESLAADHARVLLTDGGGEAREVDAEGHVVLIGAGRDTLSGTKLQVEMQEGGKARNGHLWGAVRYAQREDGKEERGQADDLRMRFGPGGVPEEAVITGGVQIEARNAASIRSVQAARMELALADAGHGRVAVRQAVALGTAGGSGAVLRVEETGVKGRRLNEVRGDRLQAEFSGVGAGARIVQMYGAGHTVVEQDSGDGGRERTTGEVLEVQFAGAGRETEIVHAVQRGGFTLVRTVPATVASSQGAGKGATAQRGQAAEAVFDGGANRLTMTGAVQVAEAGDLLQADTVNVDRGTGDAEASGNVRVSYAQAQGEKPGVQQREPVHVVAARAVEHKVAGTAEFFGAGAGDARMWQGGSQVSAPVLSFDREHRTMVAHGTSAAGDADAVRTVLTGNAPGKSGAKESGPVRVLSHAMRYSEETRQVMFSGRVRVEDGDGVLTAREATAFLSGVGGGGAGGVSNGVPGAVAGFPAGQVERIVARGSVAIEQTARRAQGEELVYTAADRTFVLTGTPSARPTMTDEAQGTITGSALRFRTGEDSVQVSGSEGEAGRVRSDLRVKPR